MMSHICLNDNKYIGKLKENPELELSKKGLELCHFTVCIERRDKSKIVDFIPCLAVGKIASNICRNLKKGSFLYIQGVNQSYEYKKDGIVYKGNEVFVKDVIFLGSNPRAGE